MSTLPKVSSTNKDVQPKWKEGNEAISFFKRIQPLQFQLTKPVTYTKVKGFNGDNYTYLYLKVKLIRRLTGSIINIFAPSTLIVAVSWVTFWIRVEAAPARVALSITSLLTLCTQVQQNKSQLPALNYITAVDIWLFVCILMVFSTLIEFAFCYNSYSRQKVNVAHSSCQERNEMNESKVNKWIDDSEKKVEKQSKRTEKTCPYCTFPYNGTKIDVICRKLFPFLFLIFSVIYWIYFLRKYNF
ncbi:unnamed protein product [Larinioides sclopetarius]|uniref:Neurotransmitter-gated ion-channel transmembrane domain-containing protein n=1 Tax=Larinioides sclopetarius TaxID=280406 RepID=A0AAV1ZK02_9ARAC